jgi:hypothetical protein
MAGGSEAELSDLIWPYIIRIGDIIVVCIGILL